MSYQPVHPPKCANACSCCRARKVKCSGGIRCKNCIDHGKECVYPPPQRRKGKRSSSINPMLERRLEQMEALLQTTKNYDHSGQFHDPNSFQHMQAPPSPDYNRPSHSVGQYNVHEHTNYRSPDGVSIAHSHSDKISLQDTDRNLPVTSIVTPRSILCTPPSTVTRPSVGPLSNIICHGEDPLTPATSRAPIDKEESILSPDNVNWEHHGPGSWLSICSNPGIKWVCERTETSSFHESAKGLTLGWTKRLKLQGSMSRHKTPELDLETAWLYSQAYFEECHYAAFGVVHRPTFEARLKSQFAQDADFDDDVSWFALRNTVYASGCRVILSKHTSITFGEAQSQAWQYFENALSVHTELLYTPTGLSAVQALALMAFYAEGLGSPALEYMICSCAARLAQSKGLHRQPARLWNLPESEIIHRNWLFWAIYCCEKAIINRSGRPSAIDDDDISCQIPTTTVSGSTIDIEIFTHAIKHAQIASQISKKLGSVSAFRRSTEDVIETVRILGQQLQQWREELPVTLRIGDSKAFLMVSGSRNRDCVLYLHFAYYGSLMAVHTIFTYPWISVIFGTDATKVFRDQVSAGTETVAQAARNIILTTRHIEINVASPAPLTFYYPMVGLINLFVSILIRPSSQAAQSDVALLDIAAGHFGHLEFMTSNELAFPFTREVAAMARATVKKAKERPATEGTASDNSWAELARPNSESWNDLDTLSALDFDMEGWNVFSGMGAAEISSLGGASYP